MIEKYAKEIAIKILGEPNKKLSRPDELRYGSFGSLSIDLKKGVVFDHEENIGYGLVDLIKKHGHDPKKFLDDMGINDKNCNNLQPFSASYHKLRNIESLDLGLSVVK